MNLGLLFLVRLAVAQTAFLRAASSGKPDSLRALIESGCDTEAKDKQGPRFVSESKGPLSSLYVCCVRSRCLFRGAPASLDSDARNDVKLFPSLIHSRVDLLRRVICASAVQAAPRWTCAIRACPARSEKRRWRCSSRSTSPES